MSDLRQPISIPENGARSYKRRGVPIKITAVREKRLRSINYPVETGETWKKEKPYSRTSLITEEGMWVNEKFERKRAREGVRNAATPPMAAALTR